MALIRCDCKCDGQDKLHGKNVRVANRTRSTPATFRCTVCLKEAPESRVVRQ